MGLQCVRITPNERDSTNSPLATNKGIHNRYSVSSLIVHTTNSPNPLIVH